MTNMRAGACLARYVAEGGIAAVGILRTKTNTDLRRQVSGSGLGASHDALAGLLEERVLKNTCKSHKSLLSRQCTGSASTGYRSPPFRFVVGPIWVVWIFWSYVT